MSYDTIKVKIRPSQQARLKEKIVAGNEAAKELAKLLGQDLPEADWHLEPDEVKL